MKAFAVALILAFSLSVPTFANAQVPLVDFAGHIVLNVPCTCSGTGFYITMIMMHPYIGPGAVVYSPPGILYSDYNLVTPGVVLLGQVVPGAHTCLLGVPPACFPPPALGTIVQVGTTLSPAP